MTTRVLVTGAAGFIGEHLLARLTAAGFEVHAFAHRTRPRTEVARVLQGDVRDEAALRAALQGVEAVVHAAALLDPITDQRAASEVNFRASEELARLASEAKVGTFLFLSSIAALGFRSKAGLVRTDATCAPTTLYGKSKRDAEAALLAASWAMRTIVVRPPTVYGPGERRNFLALVRAVDSGRMFIPGAGSNRMSTCHVDNLTHCIERLLIDRRAKGIVHVADEPTATFRELVTAISSALGRARPPVTLPLPLAAVVAEATPVLARLVGVEPPLSPARLRTLTADFALDTRRTRELGISAPVTLQQGLRQTIAWYRSAGLLTRSTRRE
ncbi:MAG: NAD-dependent epimerase/dehydratase family protein [Polyangiaceae bacterium]|nr:NAD-dependent epimerase/dehydratase family protein [Polyangiaceae bacterium]